MNKIFFHTYVCLQLPLVVPIIFVTVCALLIVVPCYVAPYEVFMGVIITVAGIPVYYMGVVWKDKPKSVQAAIGNFRIMKTFESACSIIKTIYSLYFCSKRRCGDRVLPKVLSIGQRGK